MLGHLGSSNLKPEDRKELEAGAEALKSTSLHFHRKEASPGDTGVVLLQ
ncbi:hypothetical protein PAHAL_7G054800 [Panicum hallii]|uniref:Uncharacterized protein n=1 Tax=Panicum hallii TaxID=206008 RepID=A0A2T8IB38_9POAL|nr:hypothetical protein PAHAL_7G054800 [Panicum hallii]